MDYTVHPEDKQDLLEITEFIKSEAVPELKIAMLWYVRGRKDQLAKGEDCQPA